MSPKEDVPTYKVIVIGDAGVGKTTFIRSFITRIYRRYPTNISVDVRPMTFSTNLGRISLQVWDTCGQERFGVLRDGFYIRSQAAIIMFDVSSRASYKNVPNWYKDVTRICGENIPIVLVGNKTDVKDRKVKLRQITFHREKKIRYCEVSAKSNINLEEPFLEICRRLTSDPNLEFIMTNLVADPPEGEKVKEES